MQAYEIELLDRDVKAEVLHVGNALSCLILCKQQIRDRNLSHATVVKVATNGKACYYNLEELKVRNIARQ